AAATAAGVVVCNTPGILDETTADLAFLLILAGSRRSSEAEAVLRAGRWTGFHMDEFLGRDVYGATLGLVGYGRIGRAVARRDGAAPPHRLGHRRHPPRPVPPGLRLGPGRAGRRAPGERPQPGGTFAPRHRTIKLNMRLRVRLPDRHRAAHLPR